MRAPFPGRRHVRSVLFDCVTAENLNGARRALANLDFLIKQMHREHLAKAAGIGGVAVAALVTFDGTVQTATHVSAGVLLGIASVAQLVTAYAQERIRRRAHRIVERMGATGFHPHRKQFTRSDAEEQRKELRFTMVAGFAGTAAVGTGEVAKAVL